MSKTWSTENQVANHHPQLFRHKLGSSLFLNTAMFPKPHYSPISSGIQHFSLGQAVFVSVQSVFLLVKIAVLLGLYGLKPIWSIFLWAVLPCCKNQICSSCFWLKSQCFCCVLSKHVFFNSKVCDIQYYFLWGLDILFSWEEKLNAVCLSRILLFRSVFLVSIPCFMATIHSFVGVISLVHLRSVFIPFFPGIESQQKSWVNILTSEICGFSLVFHVFLWFWWVFPCFSSHPSVALSVAPR